ncbi:hypothetical protein EHF33_06105 [Deinococcus psychrotolerans]|uniref:SPOR domain-containing protein n=1 Tax=Deinococcus psychrotolerans TaxID=2489213 RepID=A0A3G8YMJ7_9DEIO|nr:hypothetical protein [Deinococcus psychrotolerans]AZI42376.1 hypothetical protein EHF33_06105 [Deinococcus psychrotolerans]
MHSYKMVLLLSLLTSSALAGSAATPAPVVQPQQAGKVLQQLTPNERELLLSSANLGDDSGFLPGQLTPKLPFTLPTLPSQRIVGSIVRGPQDIQVYLKSGGPFLEVRDRLSAALKQQGWIKKYPSGPNLQAFVSDAPSSTDTSFFGGVPYCKPEVKGNLNINAYSAGSEVSISLIFGSDYNNGSCPQGSSSTPDNFYSRQDSYAPAETSWSLPELAPLPKTEVEQINTSYGGSESSVVATLYAPQTTEALFSHYVTALRAAGWTLTGQVANPSAAGGEERLALFRLTFKGKNLQGILQLKARPAKGRNGKQRFDVKLATN